MSGTQERYMDLVKAAALVLAEIERLDRAAPPKPADSPDALPDAAWDTTNWHDPANHAPRSPTATDRAEVLRLAREMNRRFTSMNSVPVDKATVPTAEWAELRAALVRLLGTTP